MRQRGFTLVELLVVVAIIAILASLVTVALGAARREARQADCALQLRQIGLAINIYADEHDGKLPTVARLGPQPAYGKASLRQALGPLIHNPELYHCPGDRGDPPLFADEGTSYEWNTLVNGRRIDARTMSIVGIPVSPILGDAEATFHGGTERNYLFPDASVHQTTEPASE